MSQFIPLKPRQNSDFTKRLSFFMYFFYFILLVILIRFFTLQILKAEYYSFLAEGNSKQKFYITPPRGLIFDREGVEMAKNRASYNLTIVPAYLPRNRKQRRKILKEISKEFSIPYKPTLYKIERRRSGYRGYRSVLLKENISKRKIIFLEENRSIYSFLNINEYSGRIYRYGESASHLLGYIGIVNPRELKNKEYQNLRRDNIIGKTGIERYYDHVLRGVEGYRYKIVNAIGKPIREVANEGSEMIPAKNLFLNINADLQDLAYSILYGRKGVIVITRPVNGEVLALVSSPGFDANLFINPDKRDELFKRLRKNPKKPFLNRALQGRYPSGSIFKIVTAIAGLEDGKLDPYEKIDCRKGYFELGDTKFKDWKLTGFGYENLFSALEKSVNVYFYKLGYKLGYASILEHCRKLGISRPTKIDLPGEKGGFIPTPEWKERRLKQPWYDGDTVNAAIGQGFILLTPLGANNIISIIAAGRLYQPRVLRAIQLPNGQLQTFKPKRLTPFVLKSKNLSYIREGLKRVPLTGTATYHKWLSKIPIAGKTGSAQHTGSKKTHSWFVSYGPLDKPLSSQIAITVMVESAGHGGSLAVPISSVIYNYLEGKMTREQALKTINQVFTYLENKK